MLASNNKKIIFKILTAFLLLINILNIKALAVVKPTADFYVNDYAGLLDESTKDYIINTNVNLYNKTGSQIVVVTIPSLDGDSLEEYATELFRSFGIGDKTKNNGVLLLLALQERQFRIEVGYGLEGVLTDGKTGRIQDEYIIPYLKQDNWNEGIKNGFNAVLDEVSKEYNVDVGGEKAVAKNKPNSMVMCIPYFSLIIGIILGNLKRSKVLSKNVVKILFVLYLISIIIIYYIALKQILSAIVLTMFNLIWLLPGLSIYRAKGGKGRRFLWRRFLKWRKFLGWPEAVSLVEEDLPGGGGSSRSF